MICFNGKCRSDMKDVQRAGANDFGMTDGEVYGKII